LACLNLDLQWKVLLHCARSWDLNPPTPKVNEQMDQLKQKITVFWEVTPCSMVEETNILEEPSAR
jgi:hypothetical protein